MPKNENTTFYNSVHDFRIYTYFGIENIEKWKYILRDDGTKSNYLISNFGHVKYYKRDEYLKTSHRKGDNHHMISLRLNKHQKKARNYSIHRLVAKYFIPNPLNKPQVHHKDGDPNNNFYENLQWVTASEHMKLSYDLEQRDRKFGEDGTNSKYTMKQFMKLGKLLEENKLKVKDLSLKTGISVVTIRDFINSDKSWPEVRRYYDVKKYTKLQSINPEIMEKAFRLVSENELSIEEIMKECNLPRSTVSGIINGKISDKWKYLLDKYDVSHYTNFTIRKKVVSDETRRIIKKMVKENIPTSEIIETLGLEKCVYTYGLISKCRNATNNR